MKQLLAEIQNVFGSGCRVQVGAAGTALALTVPSSRSGGELKKRRGPRPAPGNPEEASGSVTLLLSCSAIPSEDFRPACELLKKLL